MMGLPPFLRCQKHGAALAATADALECAGGCRYPVIDGIPRFVASEGYSAAFGRQWLLFSRTQLDSATGRPISRQRLERCLGGDIEAVRGRRVLEAGCGSGRFTEILLDAGAEVFAVDLSRAVEANAANCRRETGYFVCQADICRLPTAPGSFDVVLCLGVVQHTPDPEATIRALAGQLQPGGLLVLDHYPPDYPFPWQRRIVRRLLLRLPAPAASRCALALSRALLALHRLTWQPGGMAARLRRWLGYVSPLVDYYDSYRELDPKTLGAWCVLDTHDTLTDRFKHLRSAGEIRDALEAAGLASIEVSLGGNGVEARARRPA